MPVQSLFVSFERGDQPPFVTRGANLFEAGHRIRSNLPGLFGP
ncbi:MAG TPA: hypothetical protein VM934_06365 [Pyrinomonadaceae bacterium]|jgi:hypothetical protein|nr:hypothetical protein [Pyrinomonadaceae bacterium]